MNYFLPKLLESYITNVRRGCLKFLMLPTLTGYISLIYANMLTSCFFYSIRTNLNVYSLDSPRMVGDYPEVSNFNRFMCKLLSVSLRSSGSTQKDGWSEFEPPFFLFFPFKFWLSFPMCLTSSNHCFS